METETSARGHRENVDADSREERVEQNVTERPTEPTDLDAGEELYLIEQARNDDGTVDVVAYNWDKIDDSTVAVEFITPTGELQVETMDWPSTDNSGTKFEDVMEAAGHGMVGATEFGANEETIAANPDGWTLTPGGVTRWEKVKERMKRALIIEELSMAHIAASPVYYAMCHIAIFLHLDPSEPGTDFDETDYEVMMTAFIMALIGDMLFLGAILLL